MPIDLEKYQKREGGIDLSKYQKVGVGVAEPQVPKTFATTPEPVSTLAKPIAEKPATPIWAQNLGMELLTLHKVLDPMFEPSHTMKSAIEQGEMLKPLAQRYGPVLKYGPGAATGDPSDIISMGRHGAKMFEEAPLQTLFDIGIAAGIPRIGKFKAPTPRGVKPTVKPQPKRGKEPWEMTRDDVRIAEMESRAKNEIPAFSDAAKEALEGYRDLKTKPLVEKAWKDIFDGVERQHKNVIEQALASNKPVPAEVLKDYPELAKPKAPPPEVAKVETFKVGDKVTAEGMGYTITTMKKDGIRAIVKADVDGRTGLIKLSELSKTPKPSERGAVLNPFQEIASKAPKLSESGAVDAVRRVVSESRNRVKSPEGKKIIAEMEDVRADRYTLAGEFITRFRNVKRRPKGKVLTEELLQEPTRIGKPDLLTMILETERSQKKVSPASKEVRAILDDIAQEAIDAGVKVMDAEGKLKPFKPRENYVPRRLKENIRETMFDDIAKAEAKLDDLATTTQGFVDKAVIRRMRRELGEPTKVGKQIVRLSDRTKQAINHIMEKQDVSFEKAYGMLRRFLDNEKYNPFGNLEKARVLDLPSEFYESNFNRIFPDYVMGASRAIAEVRKWGPKREGVLNKMSDLAKSNPKDFELVNQLYEMSTGLWEKSRPMSPTAKKAIHAFMNYEVSTKIGLGTAAIPNISQTLISTGIKGPWLKVLSGGTRYMTSKDFRTATRSSGATVAEAMQMLTGVETRGLGTGITKAIMTPFSMINRANKALAASTAKQWIPSLMESAKKGGVKSGHAKRQLKSLGIDWEKPLTEKGLRKGMFRMASDTQLQRDLFKEPVWMNDPKLRPFALFKRFGYRQFNFTRNEVFKEARFGNPMPLLRLATGGYIGGRFVLTAKGLVKKWISGEPYDDKDQSMLQHLANVYAAVGALGMASDVFRSYSETGRGKARDIIGNILFQTTPLPIAEPISFGESAKKIAGAKEPLRQTAKELLSQAPLLRHAKKRLSKPKKKKTRSILRKLSVF